jgi:hypothetical protein
VRHEGEHLVCSISATSLNADHLSYNQDTLPKGLITVGIAFNAESGESKRNSGLIYYNGDISRKQSYHKKWTTMRLFKHMWVKIVIAVVPVVMIFACLLMGMIINPNIGKITASQARTIVSPDDKYKIVVYVYVGLTAAMPGQGSDRDGFVRVYDANDNLLCEEEATLAGQIYGPEIRWRAGSVSIPTGDGFVSCNLP